MVLELTGVVAESTAEAYEKVLKMSSDPNKIIDIKPTEQPEAEGLYKVLVYYSDQNALEADKEAFNHIDGGDGNLQSVKESF